MKLTEKQIEIVKSKASLINMEPTDFIDMIIEFFGEMNQNDLKFFVEGFSDEEEGECCGGGCHN